MVNKKHQVYYEPLQKIGYQNNGSIQIIPTVNDIDSNFNQDFKITQIDENSVKYDFFDKIYKSKMVQKRKLFQFQESLIDKLISNASQNGTNEDNMIKDIASLVYFQVSNCDKGGDKKTGSEKNNLKKLWDLKELSNLVVPNELNSIQFDNFSSDEVKTLLCLRKIIESKPKDELLKFLNLKNPENT